jgi:hypothetical protein
MVMMDRDFEMDQIKKAVDAVMNLFPTYMEECKRNWPICYKHKTEMCQVMKKGENPYFQCFERGCGHREYGI